jgi:gliding motility-associated protein GldM
MALPKEPRQKMINMMYLVLTALLALNVSSEILNAFKVVNTSLATSNKIVGDKNAVTYESFEEKAKDQQTAAKAAIWKPKAQAVKKLSDDMYNYIANLQQELKKESKLKVEEGVEHYSEDNLDAPTRLMDKNGKGKELYDKLGAYRKAVIAVLDPKEFADNPNFQKELTAQIATFEKTIPIDLTVPKGQAGKEYSNDAKGWTTNYFHMTPTVAAVTILSKLQSDVKNTEAQVIDYCHQQIGSVKLVYNKFQAIAQANTSYAMPGDNIEIVAGVGAFSDAAQPKITIGGQNVPVGADGTALWKTTASGAGNKAVEVVIEFIKPDGTPERVTKTVKYEVAMPAGVAVSPTKMNVLYIGVENPLQITAGVGAEKINASFTGGEIKRAGGNSWIAIPKTQGEHKINVTIENKTTPVTFRVKKLPDPYAYVGPSRGGSMPAANFKAMGGVIAKLESDFEAPFRVVSYTVGAIGGKIPIYQQQPNQGNRWSGAAASLIESAGPGTAVFFDNIKVVGPDGIVRDLPQMSFNLK